MPANNQGWRYVMIDNFMNVEIGNAEGAKE
jgi:hypothetical protein